MAEIPAAGDAFKVAFPFVRETYSACSADGYEELPTWRPGVRYVNVGPEDTATIADALGSAIFTVEAAFKPGRFPTRVFFTRKFVSPDGNEFGKSKLHIVTLDKFRRLTRGYAHPFGVGEPLPDRYTLRQSRELFEAMLAAHSPAPVA